MYHVPVFVGADQRARRRKGAEKAECRAAAFDGAERCARRREGAEKAECITRLPLPGRSAAHDAEKALRKQAVSAAYNGNRMPPLIGAASGVFDFFRLLSDGL